MKEVIVAFVLQMCTAGSVMEHLCVILPKLFYVFIRKANYWLLKFWQKLAYVNGN